jgi:seryl-tRNA synthetase
LNFDWRISFLKGCALKQNQALFRCGLDLLKACGFQMANIRFFMRCGVMEGVCQLEDFDVWLYDIDSATHDKNDDLFFIATVEQTFSRFHLNEDIDHEDFPLQYAGFSTYFRIHAGVAGKDKKIPDTSV